MLSIVLLFHYYFLCKPILKLIEINARCSRCKEGYKLTLVKGNGILEREGLKCESCGSITPIKSLYGDNISLLTRSYISNRFIYFLEGYYKHVIQAARYFL